jgi:SAM-dependent methyltransferase
MKEESGLDRDLENATFISSFSRIFNPDGRLSDFQRRKYEPSIALLKEECGLTSASPILDVGVGYGAFLFLLNEMGFENTHGMDPFPTSIRIASRVTRAKIQEGRIENDRWPFEPASFQCITSFDVIEHLEDPSVFFSRAYRYLQPGGYFLVTTPLKEFGYRLRKLPLIGVPDRNPTHINVHPPRFWLRLVRQSEFSLVKCWRGENLSHVRWIGHLDRVLHRVGIDPRKIPVLRSLEQSYLMLLKRPEEA